MKLSAFVLGGALLLAPVVAQAESALPWIASVMVQTPATDTMPSHLKLFSIAFSSYKDCDEAIETFRVPADFTCPPNAACSEPPLPEDTIIQRTCARGLTGSN